MTAKKKLIEVGLPLEAINKESAREKALRHGHPSTLHLWWARRPLAACRAVLFASLVDDPSSDRDRFPTEDAQQQERARLFAILEKLVKWENANNREILAEARAEILKSTNHNPPPVFDPFCGGGSILLEAQRLGLEAIGGDLNPVAVLISKALIEIPPKFADRPPVNPGDRVSSSWEGARGLAEDARYYGQWMCDRAKAKIAHLYPELTLPDGGKATVIAWLWARTIQCPNPACGAQMPLVHSFTLSKKKGKKAWVEPVIEPGVKVRFEVKTGSELPAIGTVTRRGATCTCCGLLVPLDRVRSEGKASRMGVQLMAIVARGKGERLYAAPSEEHEAIALNAQPEWKPEIKLPHNPRDFKASNYGMRTFADLFAPRQLVALNTFSDLIAEARELVLHDARRSGMSEDSHLAEGGTGALAYADAVATYLAFAVDRLADRNSALCTWDYGYLKIRNTFARQALPMSWDFAEANPFSDSTGSFLGALNWIVKVLQFSPGATRGCVTERDATEPIESSASLLISTDPPYSSNIAYADLSDFFYIWLRRSLGTLYPDLFKTALVGKNREIVAKPYFFGGDRVQSDAFFREGLTKVFTQMRLVFQSDCPLTVYYAFKQTQTKNVISSTGWETMLEALIQAGFSITATWPVRTEMSNRTVASGTNALTSSIVLVCRPRPEPAPVAARDRFRAELASFLPDALKTLHSQNIPPVDLSQASIGAGMVVFSRYEKVLESDGTPMPVRAALQAIAEISEAFAAARSEEFDSETRWAIAWFEQSQFNEGLLTEAETLCHIKQTSLHNLIEAGLVSLQSDRVRLLKREELPFGNWEGGNLAKESLWKATQSLIRALDESGEKGAGEFLARIFSSASNRAELARFLAYRLYDICAKKGWTAESLVYNRLVSFWPEIIKNLGMGHGALGRVGNK